MPPVSTLGPNLTGGSPDHRALYGRAVKSSHTVCCTLLSPYRDRTARQRGPRSLRAPRQSSSRPTSSDLRPRNPRATTNKMQSAPLRLAAQEPPEFPFTDAEAPRPRPSPLASRRSSLLQSPSASSDKLAALFGKAWAGSDEEIARRHEAEQKAFAENREL